MTDWAFLLADPSAVRTPAAQFPNEIDSAGQQVGGRNPIEAIHVIVVLALHPLVDLVFCCRALVLIQHDL